MSNTRCILSYARAHPESPWYPQKITPGDRRMLEMEVRGALSLAFHTNLARPPSWLYAFSLDASFSYRRRSRCEQYMSNARYSMRAHTLSLWVQTISFHPSSKNVHAKPSAGRRVLGAVLQRFPHGASVPPAPDVDVYVYEMSKWRRLSSQKNSTPDDWRTPEMESRRVACPY